MQIKSYGEKLLENPIYLIHSTVFIGSGDLKGKEGIGTGAIDAQSTLVGLDF